MHFQVKNTLKNNRNHTFKQKKKKHKEKREREARTLHSHPLLLKKNN
jgi:hypothetical protein